MPVLASMAVIAATSVITGGTLLIISGARERRDAPRYARERTGVGRIAIGATLLGVVFVTTVLGGVLWFLGEVFGKLATV
jgi:hypothetical protein